MQRGWSLLAGVLLGAAALLLPAGCRRPAEERPQVIIVGIDGATFQVIDPLLARGKLPNLERLIRSGVRAPLRSRLPLVSPPIWTTIATGVPRERHGIMGFTNGEGRLVSTLDRKYPTLWTLASNAGLRSAVIGWWATYPAESIKGVVISERAFKTREENLELLFNARRPEFEKLVHPKGVLKEIADLLLRKEEEAPSNADDKLGPVRTARFEDANEVKALLRVRKTRGPFDLEMILLRGVDIVSHHFWKYHQPKAPVYTEAERPTEAEIRKYGSVVEDHYAYVDALLGEMNATPSERRIVIVVSDHGFEAGRQRLLGDNTLSGTHESPAALYGILIAAGGPIRRGISITDASIFRVAPTVLHLLGLPVTEESDPLVLRDILDPAWLADHPVRTVPTYTGRPVALDKPDAKPGAESPGEERLREELRSLGYIQ